MDLLDNDKKNKNLKFKINSDKEIYIENLQSIEVENEIQAM